MSPLAGPCVRHTAHDGGEHQRGDEGEEDQVDDTLHPVVTQPGQSLDVVLHRWGGGEVSLAERLSFPFPEATRRGTHHV